MFLESLEKLGAESDVVIEPGLSGLCSGSLGTLSGVEDLLCRGEKNMGESHVACLNSDDGFAQSACDVGDFGGEKESHACCLGREEELDKRTAQHFVAKLPMTSQDSPAASHTEEECAGSSHATASPGRCPDHAWSCILALVTECMICSTSLLSSELLLFVRLACLAIARCCCVHTSPSQRPEREDAGLLLGEGNTVGGVLKLLLGLEQGVAEPLSFRLFRYAA